MDSFEGNEIHPSVIIQGDVQMGSGNRILPMTLLIGPLIIGDDNLIGPQVVMGMPGEDSRNPWYEAPDRRVVIGSRNIFREHSSVTKSSQRPQTWIGNDVFVMHGVHIPHDAILEDRVVVAPNANVGGYVHMMEGANLAMGSSVHQRGIVGAYSLCSMNSPVLQNLKPFSRYIPSKPLSVNVYALEKFGLEAYIDEVSAYVLDGKRPKSDAILSIVERYETLHRESGRLEY